jgi:hypothetical protein
MNRSSKELSFRMHAPDEQTLALARILEHGTWDEVQLYRSINNISSTRRRGVPLAGCFQANRSGGQEAFRFVIRDRDQKLSDSFDEIFRSGGMEIIRTPFRAPQANGVAERFVRTVRSECLDWLLILDQPHLERVLTSFITHYNGHRPHRALALRPPQPLREPPSPASAIDEICVRRRDRLGGMIHEYLVAA